MVIITKNISFFLSWVSKIPKNCREASFGCPIVFVTNFEQGQLEVKVVTLSVEHPETSAALGATANWLLSLRICLSFLDLSFFLWVSVLYPAPCHPPEPCISEFWVVHEPQNLEIAPETESACSSYMQHDPWFLDFGLLCRHTASDSITSESHTSGVQ